MVICAAVQANTVMEKKMAAWKASAGKTLQQGRQLAQDVGLPVQRAEGFVQQRVMPLLMKKVAANVIGFIRRTGLRVVELERGRVVCEMPLKGNSNHIGTMYAGALFTLAEFPGGALFLSTFDWRRYIPIVTDLNMQFLKPAKGTIRVEFCLSEAEIERIKREAEADGRAAFELQGELTSADGTVVARSTAQYQLREKR